MALPLINALLTCNLLTVYHISAKNVATAVLVSGKNAAVVATQSSSALKTGRLSPIITQRRCQIAPDQARTHNDTLDLKILQLGRSRLKYATRSDRCD